MCHTLSGRPRSGEPLPREREQVRGLELDLEPATARAHEDRVVGERRFVEHRRERPALAEGTDSPGYVPGGPLGELRLCEHRALSERLEVEVCVDGHERHEQPAVDIDDERLEDPPRLDAELLRRLEPIRGGRAIVRIFVDAKGDPGPL